ncbi:MAG: hypothetical protein FGM58_05735 [Acidimicrobiia bacterium]|nr:hypothetical protein [Acidimicrobiia bacterium]
MPSVRTLTATAVGVAVIAIAAVAFAFWTTTGTGSDTGTVGTAGNVTVSVNLADGNFPGDGPTGVAVSGTVTNPTNSDISITEVSGDPSYAATSHLTVDAAHSGCKLSDFALTIDPLTGSPVTLAAKGGSTTFTGKLVMNESGANQNACQGAVLTLHLVAS